MEYIDKNLERLAEGLAPYITRGELNAALALGEISSTIRLKRDSLNMNQKEFAKMMGVSQSMVSKWENGEYNFSIENLANICDKLDLSFDISLIDADPERQNEAAGCVALPIQAVNSCKKHSDN